MNEPAGSIEGVLGCPLCGYPLMGDGETFSCPSDGATFPQRPDGLADLRPESVIEAATRFSQAYRVARIAEGWRPFSPQIAARLPDVEPQGFSRLYWPLRRESWMALLGVLSPLGAPPLLIADAGAGFLWLSHRLALLGHRVVAFDLSDDADFGAGAAHLFPTARPAGGRNQAPEPGHFFAVLGDLEHPPLTRARYDVVICNASLHYVNDLDQTLEALARALKPRGALIVLDSPVARAGWDAPSPASGINRGVRVFGREELDAALRIAGLTPEWVRVRRGWLWSRRQLANRLRRRREFDFPLIIARGASMDGHSR